MLDEVGLDESSDEGVEATVENIGNSSLLNGLSGLANSVFCAPCNFKNWMGNLTSTFGSYFILGLFFIQHICKGYTYGGGASGMVGQPMMYLFRSLKIPASRMQVLSAVARTPWSLKPLIGLFSDLFAFQGYHKGPYMIASTALACLSFIILGFFWPVGENTLTLLIFIMFLQVTVTDLLSEARYAKKLKEHPKDGPNLVSFVWGGIFFFEMLSNITVGLIMTYIGVSQVYYFCIIPSISLLAPLALNWIGEERRTPIKFFYFAKDKLKTQYKLFIASIIVSLAALLNATLGLVSHTPLISAIVALSSGLTVIIAFHFLVDPTIAKVNAFFFLQHMATISIDSGAFYFFTDNEKQYPEGPHFSMFFYTTIIGLVSSTFSLCGTFFYNSWMKHWKYRTVFTFNNLLYMFVNALNIIVFKRWNLYLGIPDQVFVLGSGAFQHIVFAWTWIPSLVLLSQLCPDGVEATMYALLAGTTNLGYGLAHYEGAFLLEALGIRPNGTDAESHQFENLWLASLISTIMPIFSLILIPFLIPDIYQTDGVVVDKPTGREELEVVLKINGVDSGSEIDENETDDKEA